MIDKSFSSLPMDEMFAHKKIKWLSICDYYGVAIDTMNKSYIWGKFNGVMYNSLTEVGGKHSRLLFIQEVKCSNNYFIMMDFSGKLFLNGKIVNSKSNNSLEDSLEIPFPYNQALVSSFLCCDDILCILDKEGKVYFYNEVDGIQLAKLSDSISKMKLVKNYIFLISDDNERIHIISKNNPKVQSLSNYVENIFIINPKVKIINVLDNFYSNSREIIFTIDCPIDVKQKIEMGKEKLFSLKYINELNLNKTNEKADIIFPSSAGTNLSFSLTDSVLPVNSSLYRINSRSNASTITTFGNTRIKKISHLLETIFNKKIDLVNQRRSRSSKRRIILEKIGQNRKQYKSVSNWDPKPSEKEHLNKTSHFVLFDEEAEVTKEPNQTRISELKFRSKKSNGINFLTNGNNKANNTTMFNATNDKLELSMLVTKKTKKQDKNPYKRNKDEFNEIKFEEMNSLDSSLHEEKDQKYTSKNRSDLPSKEKHHILDLKERNAKKKGFLSKTLNEEVANSLNKKLDILISESNKLEKELEEGEFTKPEFEKDPEKNSKNFFYTPYNTDVGTDADLCSMNRENFFSSSEKKTKEIFQRFDKKNEKRPDNSSNFYAQELDKNKVKTNETNDNKVLKSEIILKSKKSNGKTKENGMSSEKTAEKGVEKEIKKEEEKESKRAALKPKSIAKTEKRKKEKFMALKADKPNKAIELPLAAGSSLKNINLKYSSTKERRRNKPNVDFSHSHKVIQQTKTISLVKNQEVVPQIFSKKITLTKPFQRSRTPVLIKKASTPLSIKNALKERGRNNFIYRKPNPNNFNKISTSTPKTNSLIQTLMNSPTKKKIVKVSSKETLMNLIEKAKDKGDLNTSTYYQIEDDPSKILKLNNNKIEIINESNISNYMKLSSKKEVKNPDQKFTSSHLSISKSQIGFSNNNIHTINTSSFTTKKVIRENEATYCSTSSQPVKLIKTKSTLSSFSIIQKGCKPSQLSITNQNEVNISAQKKHRRSNSSKAFEVNLNAQLKNTTSSFKSFNRARTPLKLISPTGTTNYQLPINYKTKNKGENEEMTKAINKLRKRYINYIEKIYGDKNRKGSLKAPKIDDENELIKEFMNSELNANDSEYLRPCESFISQEGIESFFLVNLKSEKIVQKLKKNQSIIGDSSLSSKGKMVSIEEEEKNNSFEPMELEKSTKAV